MSMNPILLHRWRTKRELTQVQLAKRWGKTPQTVMRWENGHVPIPKYVEILMQQDAAIAALMPKKKGRQRSLAAGASTK